MHRNAILKKNSGFIDPMIPDEESLLIQLCEQLFLSGFFFDDASEKEIKRGEIVILDFFEQESILFQQFIPRNRVQRFISYLKQHEWTEKDLRNRLHFKIMRGFERFSQDLHHQFNILLDLKKGLRKHESVPLQDFLLFIEAYHSLLLNPSPDYMTEKQKPIEKYTADDLLRMRKELQLQMMGKRFVQAVLKDIAKQREVSVTSLTKGKKKEVNRSRNRIIFTRPSKTNTEEMNTRFKKSLKPNP